MIWWYRLLQRKDLNLICLYHKFCRRLLVEENLQSSHLINVFLKAHSFYDHLPSVFSKHLDPSYDALLSGRHNALYQAGRWLEGRPVTLEELVEFTRIQNMFNLARNSQIRDRLMRAMREFCQFNCVVVPMMFIIDPCNSIGVLLH